ncbi:uncharacterized protein LOC135216097 isoform X2 [Macrobrachium nipponense]|uniref:uncharacterized protein LOC135216097 isoform X2 n=1 Tax=Macrobrachium nipponense TaxID=159736 RepID=UPI0030C7D7D9
MGKEDGRANGGDSGMGRSSGEESSSMRSTSGTDTMTPESRELPAIKKGWEKSTTSDEEGSRGPGGKSTKAPGAAAKKDEMAKLQKELDQEIRYRATMEQLWLIKRYLASKELDTIQWSVGVLQQSVDELQKQLEAVNKGEDFGSEYKLRYETQLELNAKLEEQTAWYVDEIDKTKEKMKQAYQRMKYSLTTLCQEFAYDQDLNDYTEFELLRLVKTLERERNNLYGDLRNKSWLLDNQSKEYYHLKELIKAYSGDLSIVNRSLEHLWRQRSLHQDRGLGGGTPVTSPGGLKWRSFLGVDPFESGQSGIRPSQRILDPRKGPIRKTAGVHSLPRLDQEALDSYDESASRKARSRYRGKKTSRAKSLEMRKTSSADSNVSSPSNQSGKPRTKSTNAISFKTSPSAVFEESSYEASNEASTTASVELSSDKS